MKKIYLVEDEKSLNDLLVTYLLEASYEVKAFSDGISAKNAISENPDLWVLDIMLPGIDGYELLKEIKKQNPKVPVIFMSARNAELDRVIGLELGCDDYMPKPFLPRELVLRVNRLLASQIVVEDKSEVILGNCMFDMKKRVIIENKVEIPLTVKEYDTLKFLIRNNGEALSRTQIIDEVWGDDYFGSERVVDDTLRRLRKKVVSLPLESVYGYGYTLKVGAIDG